MSARPARIDSREWMKVGEVAKVLNLPISTYRRWVAEGREPAEHVTKTASGYYLIRRSWIESKLTVDWV